MYQFPLSGPVLAAHPTSSGFGWAVFDESGVLVEWGIASAKERRKLRLVNRFKRLLERFEPTALVIEAHGDSRKRAERICKLYRAFGRAASGAGAQVCVYDREAVAALLGISPRSSRYDVACHISERLAELSHRMPRKQTCGASEDPRQSLFTAAGLALAYLAERGVPLPPVHPGAPE